MKKRSVLLVVVSFLFIVLGAGGLVRGVWPIVNGARLSSHDLTDSFYVSIGGVIALVGGVFMLRGAKWARWLCLAWMALHVVLSLWHSRTELLLHSAMFVILAVILFRAP